MAKKNDNKGKNVVLDASEVADKLTAVHDHHQTGEVVVKEAFGCKVLTIY